MNLKTASKGRVFLSTDKTRK